jgi:hypothetical protein
MFREMLRTQWKVSRVSVAFLLPLCIGLPIAVIRLSRLVVAQSEWSSPALDILRATARASIAFPLLAASTGCVIALCAWAWDHRTNHVYALSLPVERWRYAMMKMGAGAIILGLTALGVLIGSIIAVSTTALPEGIRGYPLAFTIRFLFAALITYAITFAFAAGTVRTTLRVFLILFVIFIGGTLLTSYLGSAMGTQITSPLALLAEAFGSWAGPFQVFGGSWMLIDV